MCVARLPLPLAMLCGLLLGLAATGCSDPDSADAMFDNYLTRLSRVTEVDRPDARPQARLPPYPDARDLVLQGEDIRVGLLDFLSFSECQLLHDISERNSGLGRVQQSTTRLRYEMRFHAKLQQCRSQLAIQDQPDEKTIELLALVEDVLERKRKALPIAYWNASFASPEFRVLFSASTAPLRQTEAFPTSELTRDLGFVLQLKRDLFQGGPNIDDAEFEQHYFRLQQNKSMGRLLTSLVLSVEYLDQAAALLEQAKQQNRLCPNGYPKQQAQYLRNVFVKFYAGEIQPYLSTLHRAGQDVLPLLNNLKQAQDVFIPEQFEAYSTALLDPDAPSGLWQRFQTSIQRHTHAWQDLLKQCRMMPEAPVGNSPGKLNQAFSATFS